jgi:hypothetical protein
MHMLLAIAQPVFEKFYDSGVTFQMNLNEMTGGNLQAGLSGYSMLDYAGNILDYTSYWDENLLQISSLKPNANNQSIFASGYRKDSCSSIGSVTIPHTHPALGIIDSLGEVAVFKHYVLNSGCVNMTAGLEVISDGSVVTWGRDLHFFTLKVDTTLAPIWAKRFVHHGGIQFMKELPGGDLLAGINMDSAGAVLARMDAMGNFLWTRSYIRPSGMAHDAIIESDSSFIITGFTDSTASTNPFTPLPATFQPKLFMMKLNGNGDVQWCKGYDSAPNYWYTRQWSRIERTLDGNYVVLATLGTPGFHFFDKPFLMKLDQNGDTLWTRSMGRNNYSYYTRDLLAVSDGGFMFSGIIWGSLPGGNSGLPYIYKTDSMGHFPCWEQTHTVQVTNLFPTDSSVTLHSIDGAVMQPAFITDTVFDPITVYDGCTFTTGIPDAVRRSRGMKIRPNPTPGQFTVDFKDPLEADSFYSVYDELGRLLYQRPLPTGEVQEEIDLSQFGKGMYVLQVTDPEGVRVERVVVE